MSEDRGSRVSYKPKTPVLFYVILAAILIGSGYTFAQQQVLLNSIEADTISAQEKFQLAKDDNAALLEEKENLQKPEYIEKIAREELGMTREGELPYIYTKEKK